MAPAIGDALVRRDHLAFGDLDLQCPGVLGPVDEADMARICRVGDVDDVPARVPERRGIEIPAIAGLMQRHLEGRLANQVGIADRLDIPGVALSRRQCHVFRSLDICWLSFLY